MHFQWVAVLISVNQLLTVANSSFNFLIYLSFCMRKGGGGGGNGGRNYGNNKENSSNNVVNLRRFSSGGENQSYRERKVGLSAQRTNLIHYTQPEAVQCTAYRLFQKHVGK